MQKKLIVLALAAAFAAPAFADTANVNVYGAVNMSVESINNGDSAAGVKGARSTKVSSNVTKLGFKGAQDLGDDVSAIWQIEQQIDIDNASTTAAYNSTHYTFATRNSFVGLSDKALGMVQLGKFDTPYKASTRSLDAFGDSLADNRSLLGGVKGKSSEMAFDGRDGDVVAYTSPVMGGVTLAVAYVVGAEQNTAATVNQGSATSMAAMYQAGNLSANLGYEVHNFGTAGSGTLAGTDGQKETAVKLGVGYKFDALYLSAIYEKTSDTLAAGAAKYDHNVWNMAAKYDINSNNTMKLAYSRASEINSVADTGATQASLGFDHKLAKTTSVYALYTVLTNGDAINYSLTDAGSTGGGFAATGNGSRVSALALGVKHAF